jgi:hypothetical protein
MEKMKRHNKILFMCLMIAAAFLTYSNLAFQNRGEPSNVMNPASSAPATEVISLTERLDRSEKACFTALLLRGGTIAQHGDAVEPRDSCTAERVRELDKLELPLNLEQQAVALAARDLEWQRIYRGVSFLFLWLGVGGYCIFYLLYYCERNGIDVTKLPRYFRKILNKMSR